MLENLTENMVVSSNITGLLISLGICVVLPIMVVWLTQRSKLKAEQNRKDIILAALDKNANINIEDLVKQMNRPNKLIKEKLLRKLQLGLIFTLIGIALVVTEIVLLSVGYGDDECVPYIVVGAMLTLGGIPFLISYFVGKKLLAREMEAEEKNMQQN